MCCECWRALVCFAVFLELTLLPEGEGARRADEGDAEGFSTARTQALRIPLTRFGARRRLRQSALSLGERGKLKRRRQRITVLFSAHPGAWRAVHVAGPRTCERTSRCLLASPFWVPLLHSTPFAGMSGKKGASTKKVSGTKKGAPARSALCVWISG